MARGLSLVAGGAVSACSGPAQPSSSASAGRDEWRGLPQKTRPSHRAQESGFPFETRIPTLGEIFAAHPRDAGWTGFLLAQLGANKPLLWIQERMAILESGRVHPPGLALPNLIHVEVRDSRDALWAMEEGLRCCALSAVVGEIWGDPKPLDFTATRRLAVASERSGVAAFLIRLGGTANLSGARMRWRIASLPSLANDLDHRAPGTPAWDAELFRARSMPPGRWSIVHEAGAFNLLAASRNRAVGQGERLSA